jgi:hypothetical protein
VQRLLADIPTWKPTLFFHEGDISYARCGAQPAAAGPAAHCPCWTGHAVRELVGRMLLHDRHVLASGTACTSSGACTGPDASLWPAQGLRLAVVRAPRAPPAPQGLCSCLAPALDPAAMGACCSSAM